MIKFILILTFCGFLSSCGNDPKALRRQQMTEEGVDNPTTIEEYRDAINKYKRRIDDISTAQSQVGIWYKILGSRYIDKQMFGEALKCYEEAIKLYPTNQNLYYYVGLCAGYMAKSALDYTATGNTSQRANYLLLSESAYKRAIEIEPRYFRALYGLGVLYVFEMDKPIEAIPILELACDIEKRNTDAMMVLARAYYMTYDTDSAVAMYDKIIETTKSEERKAEAEANKQAVLNANF